LEEESRRERTLSLSLFTPQRRKRKNAEA